MHLHHGHRAVFTQDFLHADLLRRGTAAAVHFQVVSRRRVGGRPVHRSDGRSGHRALEHAVEGGERIHAQHERFAVQFLVEPGEAHESILRVGSRSLLSFGVLFARHLVTGAAGVALADLGVGLHYLVTCCR